MVLPEGTRESKVSRPKTLIALGAGAVLLLAAAALGLATAPDEVTAQDSTTTTTVDEQLHEPTTTTSIDIETFSVGEIATGHRLSWREAPSIGPRWPIELLEHKGQMFLFTTQSIEYRGRYPGIQSSDLEVWVSENGIQWHSTGVLTVPGYAVHTVSSVGDELLALGIHIENVSPHIWRSLDGVDWSRSDLPMMDFDSGSIPWLADAAKLGTGQLVVVGTAQSDSEAEILERLPSEIREHVPRYGMGLAQGPEGRVLQVHAPLGIVGYSATLEELGIDDETANDFFNRGRSESGFVWVSSESSEWSAKETDDLFVEDLWSPQEGGLLVSGWNSLGPSLSHSVDGISWERIETNPSVVADEWNGTLVGVRSQSDLALSQDGREWESVGTAEVLPRSLHWSIHPIEIGEAGIAAIARTRDGRGLQTPSPTTIQVEGHTLTVDPTSGVMNVTDRSGLTMTIPIWDEPPEDLLAVNFENETITFFSPESGEVMFSVGFATLRQIESAAFGSLIGERVLLVGDHGGDWRVFDLSEEIGRDQEVALMRVLGDRLILITYPPAQRSDGSTPDISIRVTTLR